jgi:hypothetical protein
MKKMYRLSVYWKKIEERNVVKETEYYITSLIDKYESKEKKDTDHYKWFNSREEAEAGMTNILKENVESAERNIIESAKAAEQKLKKAREEYLNYITSLAS